MKERTYEELCGSATSAKGILQGKWRIPILCALQGGPVRLGQLVRLMPTASKKVLGENLHLLQREGVLVRIDLSETLLHVEYDYSEGFRSRMTAVLTSLAVLGELRLRSAPKTEVYYEAEADLCLLTEAIAQENTVGCFRGQYPSG